jgi:hypothetical protein
VGGYLLVPHERVPETYNAGFSMYIAAWPLLREYPGHRFQSGLPGTWMFAQHDTKPDVKFYSDIEGGLGWWTDTRFPTIYPKFIMGGVGPDFSVVANNPAHGWGTWDKPRGLYGVAQLSPWVVFPIDGLNIAQGACGGLVGYGYLTLPLLPAKAKTAGQDVPTGENCWTLFLNTGNFKGPLAFFTPYFWSHTTIAKPQLKGLLLDSRPAGPNRALQMETQYFPAVLANDAKGDTWARVWPASFPRGANGDTVVIHRVTAYDKRALWDATKTWLEGGPTPAGTINLAASATHVFKGGGGSTWKIHERNTPREQQVPAPWRNYAQPFSPDPTSYGFQWDYNVVGKFDSKDGPLVSLPEFFRLGKNAAGKPEWLPVKAADVPAETGLREHEFKRPSERKPQPYTTPEEPESCWRKPGPKAGPFQVKLGDGSLLTYYWYRFCDQPALLNADLTDAEREALQAKVVKLHRVWTKDREYLPPPTVGKLADLDPAQLVTPPPGLEAGYVPIATRHELAE